MTYSAYNTVETLERIPAVGEAIDWPGIGGCQTRHTTLSVSGVGVTAGVDTQYQSIWATKSKDTRHLRGKNPKGSVVPFSFTPYWTSDIVTRNYLLRRYHETHVKEIFRQYGDVHRNPTTCNPVTISIDHQIQRVRYNTVTHLFNYPGYVVNNFNDQDISNALAKVRSSAVTEALTAYDALTDIAQLSDIPRLVKSVSKTMFDIARLIHGRYNPSVFAFLKTDWKSLFMRRSPRSMLKVANKLVRRLGNEWMSYRYGIMPLVYSYLDAAKACERGETSRVRKSIVVSPRETYVTLPSSSSYYKRIETVGEVRVSAEVFQHFSSEEIARLSGVGFNPVVTAWELIPMSFVFDWFVNMGDYLAQKTSSTLASTLQACWSRRDKYSENTYAHYPMVTESVSHSYAFNTPWNNPALPTLTTLPDHILPEEDLLFQSREVNSYVRELFGVRDVQLRLDPSISWRRAIDGSVLSLNFLKSIVSHMKRS